MATVVLAYWAPVYVTVDTEAGEVVEIRLVRSGIRSGPPIRGKASPNGVECEAARLFMQTLADGEALSGQPMPEIKIR